MLKPTALFVDQFYFNPFSLVVLYNQSMNITNKYYITVSKGRRGLLDWEGGTTSLSKSLGLFGEICQIFLQVLPKF